MNKRDFTAGVPSKRSIARSRLQGKTKHVVIVVLLLLVAGMVPFGVHYLSKLMVTDGSSGSDDSAPVAIATPNGAANPAAGGAAVPGGNTNAVVTRSLGGAGGAGGILTVAPKTPKPPKVPKAPKADDVVPEGATTMDILFVDGETKEPVPGVQVQVSGVKKRFKGTSKADGHLVVPTPPTKTFNNYQVNAKAKGYVTKDLMWQPDYPPQSGDIPATYTLTLVHPVKIGGKILDEKGQPIAGATVVVEFNRNSGSSEGVGTQHEQYEAGGYNAKAPILTKEDGSWTFNGAPPNAGQVSLGAWDYHHISQEYFNVAAFDAPAKLYDKTATLTLPTGTFVEGVVTDAQGAPVAGASVALGNERMASNVIPAQKTDSSGKFSYGIASGTNETLTVTAKGYAPTMKQFVVGSEKQTLSLKLDPAQHAIIRVVDGAGHPISKATVAIEGWRGTRVLNIQFQTDANGRYTWKDAPADEVEATAFANGFQQIRNLKITPGDKENVITLGSPMKLTGSVTDEATGQPVEKFKVTVGIVFDNQGNGEGAPQINWQPGWRQVQAEPGGKFTLDNDGGYAGMAVRISASGYLPADSRVYKISEGTQDIEIKLKPGKDLVLTVQTPDSKPVSGASAYIVHPQESIFIQNGESRNQQTAVQSDAAGKLDFPPQSGKYRIAVMTGDGYAEVTDSDIAKSATVVLQPFGHIHGTVMIGTKPAANVGITFYTNDRRYDQESGTVQYQTEMTTDADGKFAADRLRPGHTQVARAVKLSERSTGFAPIATVDVVAGQTVDVTAGGTGRPVVGSVVIPDDLKKEGAWEYRQAALSSSNREVNFTTPMPDDIKSATPDKQQKWWQEFNKTEAGKAFMEKVRKQQESRRYYPAPVAADGTFRIEDVPAGNYDLAFQIYSSANDFRNQRLLGSSTAKVVVPEMAGGRSDEPLTVPPVKITYLKKLAVGDVAPDLTATNSDGKPLKLSDFAGKFVLAQIFVPFNGAAVDQTPVLQAAFDVYGKDPRLVILNLNNAGRQKPAASPWITASLNLQEMSYAILQGVYTAPTVVLIGPDQKAVAVELKGDSVMPALTTALAAPQAAADSAAPPTPPAPAVDPATQPATP